MLVLPNFGHMNTSTIEFEPRDKILLMRTWTETDVVIFTSNFFLFQEGLEHQVLLTHQICNHVDQNNF